MMPVMPAPGILAIWNDCASGREREYERWYRTEHLAERVGIPGFRSGWRYAAVDAEPRYFTFYVTESPAVLFGAAYRARLDDPTPLTRQIMAGGVFRNGSRTECEQVLRIGHTRGAFAALVRYDEPPDLEAIGDVVREAATDDAVLRAEVWQAVAVPERSLSREQALRPPDATIAACVLLETSDEQAARTALAAALLPVSPTSRSGIYRLLCALLETELEKG